MDSSGPNNEGQPDWLSMDMRPAYLDQGVLCSEGWNGFEVWLSERKYLYKGHRLARKAVVLTLLGLSLLLRDTHLAMHGDVSGYPEDVPGYVEDYQPEEGTWNRLVEMVVTVLADIRRHVEGEAAVLAPAPVQPAPRPMVVLPEPLNQFLDRLKENKTSFRELVDFYCSLDVHCPLFFVSNREGCLF